MKYFNTGFAPNKSTFVDIGTDAALTKQLGFSNKESLVRTTVGGTRMTSGQVSFVSPFKVDCSEACDDTTLTESVKISWNVRYGNAASLDAMRAEMNRVLDLAIAEYGALQGLVPPVYATFESE